MTGKDSITEPQIDTNTTGWTHHEPAADCPYKDECSSHSMWCGSCKKNKARGKRNYYEPDSYPWPWYGDPYPWQDHTTISWVSRKGAENRLLVSRLRETAQSLTILLGWRPRKTLRNSWWFQEKKVFLELDFFRISVPLRWIPPKYFFYRYAIYLCKTTHTRLI